MALKFSLGSIKLIALRQLIWSVQRHLSKRILVLEFRPDSLVVTQFQLSPDKIKLCGFVRETLPEGAVERGVPSDPQLMSQLISSLCKEQRLVAHRALVVLPAEAVHLSSHWLPSNIDIALLQNQLLDPAPPILLPFPLDQTDFDVLPSSGFSNPKLPGQSLYSVLAVANRLTDRVLQCLEISDQECLRIDLSCLSLVRHSMPHMVDLLPGQVVLILDFDFDQTHVVASTLDGPIHVDRLTSIRSYPHGDEDLQANYLPLAAIDLQAFVADLSHLIDDLSSDQDRSMLVSKIIISGVNSAHPNLHELLSQMLSVPVFMVNLFEIPGLHGLDQLSLTESCYLHRVTGAAAALVPYINQTTVDSFNASNDEVSSPSFAELTSHSSSPSLEQVQHVSEDEALELAMYQNSETTAAEILPAPDSINQEPPSQPEQPEQAEQSADESFPSLSFSPVSGDDEPPPMQVHTPELDFPDSEPRTPTNDPSTWPTVGKRRRRYSQIPTPTTPAAPWVNSEQTDPRPGQDELPDHQVLANTSRSPESESFKPARSNATGKLFSDQNVDNKTSFAFSKDKDLTSDSELKSDNSQGSDLLELENSGLFSFGSDVSAVEETRSDVVDESDDDDGYTLGLGEP